MVGTKISGLTGGPSYCPPGGAGHASPSSTPLVVPRGASASRGEDTALAAGPIIRRGTAGSEHSGLYKILFPYLRMLVVGDIRARSYARGQQSLDDETTLYLANT